MFENYTDLCFSYSSCSFSSSSSLILFFTHKKTRFNKGNENILNSQLNVCSSFTDHQPYTLIPNLVSCYHTLQLFIWFSLLQSCHILQQIVATVNCVTLEIYLDYHPKRRTGEERYNNRKASTKYPMQLNISIILLLNFFHH